MNFTPIIIGFIVLQGFLLSRLFIYSGLVEYISYKIIFYSKGLITSVLIRVFLLSTVISIIIPNIVAIITLIPVLEKIQTEFLNSSLNDKVKRQSSALLIFVAMFGCNLGGLGSITGSPLNLLVLGFLTLHQIPNYQFVNFFTWLLYGIPIVISLSIFITFIIKISYSSYKIQDIPRLYYTSFHNTTFQVSDKIALIITIISIAIWLITSIWSYLNPYNSDYICLFLLIYTIIIFILLFLLPFSIKNIDGSIIKSPLIQFSTLFKNLPTKGLGIIIISVIISYFLSFFKIDQQAFKLVGSAEEIMKQHVFFTVFIFSIFSIFLSEFFSNTASSIGLFNIIILFHLGDITIPLLIGVSLAASIPSMTPIATPVNAFAIGNIKGAFHPKLIYLGFMMNIITSLIISIYATYFIIPLFHIL